MSNNKKVAVDVAQMRSEIAQITGKLPESFGRYLQIRLAALKRTKPEDLPRAGSTDRAVPLTVSLGARRRALAVKMAEKAEVSMSELVRHALDDYAKRNGFGKDIESIAKAGA